MRGKTQGKIIRHNRIIAKQYKQFVDANHFRGRRITDNQNLLGNHDHIDNLLQVSREYNASDRHVIQCGWQFVMLDSSVPGKVFGALAESELAFLSETLEQHPDIPAVIALHHHPVDIGSDWMEKIGLTNRDAFWQVLDRFPQVRIVLWGHIHQEHERERNGVQLLATPSTCI